MNSPLLRRNFVLKGTIAQPGHYHLSHVRQALTTQTLEKLPKKVVLRARWAHSVQEIHLDHSFVQRDPFVLLVLVHPVRVREGAMGNAQGSLASKNARLLKQGDTVTSREELQQLVTPIPDTTA